MTTIKKDAVKHFLARRWSFGDTPQEAYTKATGLCYQLSMEDVEDCFEECLDVYNGYRAPEQYHLQTVCKARVNDHK